MANASSTAEKKRQAREAQRTAWPDARLVRECLDGNEEAWSALIDKYKNLIFSIPIKYGFSQDDATDIFQSVCLELLSELPKLREAQALPKWIMQITAHKCFHRKQQQQRVELSDPNDEVLERSTPSRQAMAELPERCRQLVHMLFFVEPARPYQEIAAELGIAVGSIGFIRQRCLEKLRKRLLETGFS
jgi:RNA polymerase sigma factor (sigma-70 family)